LKRDFRLFLRLWHLKCVVLVPDKGEVVLARFTSVASKRRVGRLEFFLGMLLIDFCLRK
jgi:hypothetical protein